MPVILNTTGGASLTTASVSAPSHEVVDLSSSSLLAQTL